MKKISLLLSTLGGAMGGYLLSNKKLREEMMNAKDPEVAAKSLGKHLQRDGKKIAQQMKEFMESEEVQSNLNKAKSYTKQKMDEASSELQGLVDDGKEKARSTAKKGAAKAKKSTKKAAAKGKKAARKTSRRVKTKTRKLS